MEKSRYYQILYGEPCVRSSFLGESPDFPYSCNGSCYQLEQYAKQTMRVLLTAPSREQTRYGGERVFLGVTETSVLFGINASLMPDPIVSRNVALP